MVSNILQYSLDQSSLASLSRPKSQEEMSSVLIAAQAVPCDKLIVPTEEGINSIPTSVICW